jgi:hypothetical protein
MLVSDLAVERGFNQKHQAAVTKLNAWCFWYLFVKKFGS